VPLTAYLKSAVPAAVALCSTLIAAVSTGALNLPEVETGVTGILAALVAYATTNGSVGISRYAKALGPAFLTLTAVLVHALIVGELNIVDTRIAVAGLLSAGVTFLVPNVPLPARAP
jgi:hypothetical protein